MKLKRVKQHVKVVRSDRTGTLYRLPGRKHIKIFVPR